MLLNIFLIKLEKININQYQKLHSYLFFYEHLGIRSGNFLPQCYNLTKSFSKWTDSTTTISFMLSLICYVCASLSIQLVAKYTREIIESNKKWIKKTWLNQWRIWIERQRRINVDSWLREIKLIMAWIWVVKSYDNYIDVSCLVFGAGRVVVWDHTLQSTGVLTHSTQRPRDNFWLRLTGVTPWWH